MLGAGFSSVDSFNPYWDRLGRTFEDRDGYRVVIQRELWRSTLAQAES
jgi:prolyl oligopeptidase